MANGLLPPGYIIFVPKSAQLCYNSIVDVHIATNMGVAALR